MGDPAMLREGITNDFEGPVFARYPEIGAIKLALLDQGAVFALMSGSGSSVYGFFDSPGRAAAAVETIRPRGCRMSLTAPGFLPGGEDR
jgi:4-diphosphocytidyl-2-C-methyl-D-erythritol kinase